MGTVAVSIRQILVFENRSGAVERLLKAALSCGLISLGFGGCSARDPFKTAPPAASQPWPSSENERLANRLQAYATEATPVAVNTSRSLTLVELVDLAQRNNRTTRVAWQATREAAAAVGLSEAEFFPMLAVLASYGGGFWELDMNLNSSLAGVRLPNNLVGAVFGGKIPKNFDLDLEASGAFRMLNTGAALRWMLFDFGERQARVTGAQRMQVAANLTFNAAHQGVVMKVLESYYAWEAAKRDAEAAASSAEAARKFSRSAAARAEQGLLTEPLLLQARQAEAETDYALQSANAAVEIAWVDVAEAVGIPPGLPVRVSQGDFLKIEKQLQKPLDAFIRAALSSRPDLLAKVAVVQAKEAEIRAARANLLPKLSLEAVAGYTRFDTGIQTSGPLEEMGFGLQNYGGFLTVQWPLFTGFGLENKARLAETQRQAAAEELALAKEKSIAEVWRAYVRAKNALASRASAGSLVKATRENYDASLAGFEQGLVPVQDVLTAHSAWTRAISLHARAESAIGTSVAALVFGAGQLNSNVLGKDPPRGPGKPTSQKVPEAGGEFSGQDPIRAGQNGGSSHV